MENIKEEIRETLDKKNFCYKKLTFLAGDASERKYFDLIHKNKKYVVMYDKDNENLKKFIKISDIFRNRVSVPLIIEDFKKNNLLILENFGPKKYGSILKKENRKKLYNFAVDAIINLQKIKTKKLPNYSTKMFIDESNLFFDWYTKKKIKDEIREKFNSLFVLFLDHLKDLPQVVVHRDYHVDNLFYLSNRKNFLKCGLIDYQDAVIGPCAYDIVSLTQDARVDVSQKMESLLIKHYLESNRKLDKKLFFFCYQLLAIQRHLKVLGIFCRLSIRDKKKQYLKHLPRVKKLLYLNLQKKNFKKLSFLIFPLLENV